MNKKVCKYSIFAILTILIFSFNKVYAAQELTCVYKGGIMFTQDSNGNMKIYNSPNKTAKIDDVWLHEDYLGNVAINYKFTPASNVRNNKEMYDKESDTYLSCPNYISDSQKFDSSNRLYREYTFHKNWGLFRSNLIDSSNTLPDTFQSSEDKVVELTCFYEKGYALTQKEGGQGAEFQVKTSSGYRIGNSTPNLRNTKYYNASTNTVIACPSYVTVKSPNAIFYDDSKKGKNALVSSFNSYIDDIYEFEELEPVVIEDITACKGLFGNPEYMEGGSDPAYYLTVAFSVIRYVAIILLIVLTVIDFVSAIASQDNDIMNKAIKKLGKRFILCIVIFLLPSLIKFILQYIYDRSIDLCGIGGF